MALTLDKAPLYDKLVDENGFMSPVWRNWQGSFSDNLETYISQFGIVLPPLTTAQRDSIASPQQGTMILNTTTGEPQIFLVNTWRNITHT